MTARIHHPLNFLLPLILMVACGEGGTEATELEPVGDTTLVATGTVIDLASFDVPLMLDLGDMATLGVDTAAVIWNEEFGHLDVSAGAHFGLIITEEPADIARLKADLDRDMLRKHTVIEETPEKLVYRSQFPDEDLVFVHMYQVVRAGEREFVVEDRADARFNEADIARMCAAVRAQRPV